MKRLEAEYSHVDPRRTITQLITADIKQVNVYEANYGAKLGDHFHNDTIEYFYVIRGTMKYNDHLVVRKGDLFYPEKKERHTLEVVSDKATFLTFLTKPYDPKEPDIHV